MLASLIVSSQEVYVRQETAINQTELPHNACSVCGIYMAYEGE